MIQGEAPLTVDFTDASSPTTAIATRLWDFGDGSSSTDQNPSHTYSSTGVYEVTLTIGNGISESIYRDFVLVRPIVPATSYWSLDETSGTKADLVSGHDLTPSGSPTTTTGRLDNGVLFSPNTNDLLSVAHHADLQGGDVDLSVACWLKGTTDSPSADQYVVVGIQNEWKVYISGFGFYTNHLRFGWWESDASFISTWGPILIYDNTWHFVCAWRDATAQTINLQIDGGEIFSEVSANGGQVLTNGFAIGGYDNSGKILAGTVDEVFVYRGLWTDQQKALLASLPPQPTQTNVERAAQVMLDISNDGGKTWIAQPWRSAGKQGEYLKRVRWNRLGAARRRVYQVSVTDPVAWKVVGAYLPGQGNGNG